jgi:hypothetical protein
MIILISAGCGQYLRTFNRFQVSGVRCQKSTEMHRIIGDYAARVGFSLFTRPAVLDFMKFHTRVTRYELHAMSDLNGETRNTQHETGNANDSEICNSKSQIEFLTPET